jgi:integrase
MDAVISNRIVINKIKISAYLKNWGVLNDGSYSIMYRITFQRNRKLISAGFSSTIENWDSAKCRVKAKHPEHLIINATINQNISLMEQEVMRCNLQGKWITSSHLVNMLQNGSPKAQDLMEFIKLRIDEQNALGNIGTKNSYLYLLNKLKIYAKKNLYFSDIDYNWLTKYKQYLQINGYANGGISHQFRALKAVFNEALKRDIIDASLYPFNKFNISDLKSNAKPKTLTKEQTNQIEALMINPDSSLFDAWNYYIFSYYVLGSNPMDIFKLKWSDIEDDYIIFNRSKTSVEHSCRINKKVRCILNYYLSKRKFNNPYVFPVLNENLITPAQIHNKVCKTKTAVNRSLKAIATMAGIDKPLCMAYARYSFANDLQLAGVSKSLISKLMRHSSEKVTDGYLNKLPQVELDKAMMALCA